MEINQLKQGRTNYSSFGYFLDKQTFIVSSNGEKKEQFVNQNYRKRIITDQQELSEQQKIKLLYQRLSPSFKVVSRKKKGFFRQNQPEKSYENYYKPKFEQIKPHSPCFSIGKQRYQRALTSNCVREDPQKDQTYKICYKNPFFKLTKVFQSNNSDIDPQYQTEYKNTDYSNQNNGEFNEENQQDIKSNLKNILVKYQDLNQLEISSQNLLSTQYQSNVSKNIKSVLDFKKQKYPRLANLLQTQISEINTSSQEFNPQKLKQNLSKTPDFSKQLQRQFIVKEAGPSYFIDNNLIDKIKTRTTKCLINLEKSPQRIDQTEEDIKLRPSLMLQYSNSSQNKIQQIYKRTQNVFFDKQKKRDQFIFDQIIHHNSRVKAKSQFNINNQEKILAKNNLLSNNNNFYQIQNNQSTYITNQSQQNELNDNSIMSTRKSDIQIKIIKP